MKKLFNRVMPLIAAFLLSMPVFGQLTPGSPIASGTALYLTPNIAPTAANFLSSSGNLSLVDWTKTTTTATAQTTYSIENGTVPTLLTTSAGLASEISQLIAPQPNLNQLYIVSAYFTTKQSGAQITNASLSSQIGVRLTSTVTPQTFSLTFNPSTGQILNSVGTGIAVSVQTIPVPSSITNGTVDIWYRVALGFKISSIANTDITPFIKPSTNATVGAVLSYGAQFERVIGTTSATSATVGQPTALILTPSCGSANCANTYGVGIVGLRGAGSLPRQASIDTRPFVPVFPTSTYTSALNGMVISRDGISGGTLTLPASTITNGEYFSIANFANASSYTVTGAANVCIATPTTLASATPANSVTIAVNTFTTFIFNLNTSGSCAASWIITDSYAGGSGTIVPAPGGAGTILRSDGTNWAVSQDTWPDLIASGNVVFATAANTVGSNNSFTWASNVLTSPSYAIGSSNDLFLSRNGAARALISGDGTGSATGQVGWVLGNYATLSSALWSSAVTVGTTSYAMLANGGSTQVNAPSGGSVLFNIADVTKVTIATGGGVTMNSLTTAAGTPNSICQNNATKEITVNAALTCTVSSARFKSAIRTFNDDGTAIIMKLKPSTFFYKDRLDRSRIGLIAEDLDAVDSRLSEHDADGRPNSIDFPAIMAVLIKTAQEQQVKITSLQRRIDRMEAANNAAFKRAKYTTTSKLVRTVANVH